MFKNLCSIPNRFWESECSKICSHNYMLFLGSGTDLGDSSYVKNVTLLMQLAISFLSSKNFQLFVKKNAAYYTLIGVLYPDRGIYPDWNVSPAWLMSRTFANCRSVVADQCMSSHWPCCYKSLIDLGPVANNFKLYSLNLSATVPDRFLMSCIKLQRGRPLVPDLSHWQVPDQSAFNLQNLVESPLRSL